MLIIRLARVGKKNKAQFKIMVQEKSMAPGGRHVEILGSYNPHSKETVLKEERIKYWLSQGAQTSDTVHNLLVTQKVIEAEKRAVKMPAKKVVEKDNKKKKEAGEKVEASIEASKEDFTKSTDKKTEALKEKDKKVEQKEEKKEEAVKADAKTTDAKKEDKKTEEKEVSKSKEESKV